MRKAYILMGLAACLAMQSCYKDQEDLFSESAANRLTESAIKFTKALESSKQGWLLQYYPGGSSQAYGGYNTLLTFKDGKATISTETQVSAEDNPWKEYTSLYRVNTEQGAVLSFDTYNPALHFYTEPQGSDAVDGLQGDFEFVIMDVQENEITLQGKRYKTMMKLTRLPENFDKKAFTEKVAEMEASIKYSDFNIEADGKELGKLTFNYNTLTGTADDKSVTYPFTFTEKGIQFVSPVTINGKEYDALTFDAKTQSFTGEGLTLKGQRNVAYEQWIGQWTLADTQGASYDLNITEGTYGQSYSSTGFSVAGIPFSLTFNFANGTLALPAQKLTSLGSSGDLWLMPWDTTSGYLTWSEQIALEAVPDKTNPNKYNLVDNGMWGANVADSYYIGVIANNSLAGNYGRIVHPYLIKK